MLWEYRWGDKGFYDDEMGLGPFDYVALGFIYVSAAYFFFFSFTAVISVAGCLL